MDIELFKEALFDLEWYVLREVEKLVEGTGTACPVTLYGKIELCIRLRRELGLIKNIVPVEEYIRCNYEDEFVNAYINIINNHTEDNCPNEIYKNMGACCKEMLQYVRPPRPDELKEIDE